MRWWTAGLLAVCSNLACATAPPTPPAPAPAAADAVADEAPDALASVTPIAEDDDVEPSTYEPPPDPDHCPTEASDVPPERCIGLPAGYGTTAEQPLEWGMGGVRALYFGRLVCAGGGWATTRRLGSSGDAPVASTSPRSGFGAAVDSDILDRWEVACPGAPPIYLFSNMYRCGSPCPPPPLTVMPAAAEASYRASFDAMKAQDVDTALRLAEETVRLAPASERNQSWLGVTRLQAHQYDGAIEAFDAARKMIPGAGHQYGVYIAEAHKRRGDLDRYFAQLDATLAELPAGHALVPELQCKLVSKLERAGDKAGAKALATTACAGGYERCCAGGAAAKSAPNERATPAGPGLRGE